MSHETLVINYATVSSGVPVTQDFANATSEILNAAPRRPICSRACSYLTFDELQTGSPPSHGHFLALAARERP